MIVDWPDGPDAAGTPAGAWLRDNTTPWDWPLSADVLAQAAANGTDERHQT